MLNRYAELLFWAGRYIERVGNYARLIDVNYHMRHELYGHQDREYIWERLIESTGDIRRFEELYSNINAGTNELTVLHYLTFERSNTNSLFACVQQARSNIRTLRQLVPVELWEMINSFYIWFKDQNVSLMMLRPPHLFYQKVREWATLFGGVVDSIMIRGQEWSFIQAGKYIERADNTLRVVHAGHRQMVRAPAAESGSYACQRTVALLKSVGAYESFRKLHSSEVAFEKGLEFMLVNRYYPHSVQYALSELAAHCVTLQLHGNGRDAIAGAADRLSDAIRCVAAGLATDESAVTEADLSRLLIVSGQLGYAASAAFRADGVHVGA